MPRDGVVGGGDRRVGLWLCALPAFTLVSLYQLDNALMKHDRTSFHSHVGANASKCWQLHCFVARAGKGNFKWPRSNVLFSPWYVEGITAVSKTATGARVIAK